MYDVDAVRDRCLILATDGVWNVLNPDMAVDTVFDAERNNEKFMINPQVSEIELCPLDSYRVFHVLNYFDFGFAPSCPAAQEKLCRVIGTLRFQINPIPSVSRWDTLYN